MNLKLTLIAYDALPATLPLVNAYLEEAATRTRGRSTASDIIRSIFNAQYLLWVIFHPESRRVHGCFVTEEKVYPRLKMLCIQHCVIDEQHMVEVEDEMQEVASRYAADAGCAGIEFLGRPGWKRHAEKNGFTAQSVAYTKFLKVPT